MRYFNISWSDLNFEAQEGIRKSIREDVVQDLTQEAREHSKEDWEVVIKKLYDSDNLEDLIDELVEQRIGNFVAEGVI